MKIDKINPLIGLLLICTLLFSSTLLIFGNFASATTCAANFLPNNYKPYVDFNNGTIVTLDTPQEVNMSGLVFDYLISVLLSRYPMYNPYNETCTDSDFKTILSYLQGYDNAVIYSKGHRDAKITNGYSHYGLIMNNNFTVWDYEIFDRTSSKNVHTFIWHCETGIQPSPYYNPTNNNNRGLPVAFTHKVTIGAALGGTSGNQVYLGWTNNSPSYNPLPGGSPQYTWNINVDYLYAQIACLYYWHMGQNSSTMYALDELCKTIYGTNGFTDTFDLCGWLVAYGNIYLELP